VIHYHGTPVTPLAQLYQLAGRHFCVSYARPDQIDACHRIGQSVMLDNGAFSIWRDPKRPPLDPYAWFEWAEEWLDYPTTWAVIPDSIDGGLDANRALVNEWLPRVPKGAPVWHLHEPVDWLLELAQRAERVCFGSSGAFAVVGTDAWHRRISQAFDALADDYGRVPWVHMLRGMSQSGGPYPFASVDSTDVARNHNRRGSARALADRWDGLQCPPRWDGQAVEQTTLEAHLAA
jgi:hypothetical protein